jgi:tight adherence protein C
LGFWKSGREQLIDDRIHRLRGSREQQNISQAAKNTVRNQRISAVAETFLLSDSRQKDRLQARFLEAGIYEPWVLSIYVTCRFILMFALPTLCFVAAYLGRISWYAALLSGGPAAAAGICLPYLWLERRRARRHLILRRAIPDFLDLIVACLSGGLSVQAALRQVADELKVAHPDLCSELDIVLREIELGCTLDHALQQLASRTGLDELRTLRSFIQQTTKLGTTITDALQQMAEMLRIQREQRAEELAQKAAVKILFPTMLFIFPTVFVVLAGPAAIQIREGLKPEGQQESSPTRRK